LDRSCKLRRFPAEVVESVDRRTGKLVLILVFPVVVVRAIVVVVVAIAVVAVAVAMALVLVLLPIVLAHDGREVPPVLSSSSSRYGLY
jgi:uncharacterized membrane protein